jgi:hypothetical protein
MAMPATISRAGWLRLSRRALGFTREVFAARIGWTPARVAAAEVGMRPVSRTVELLVQYVARDGELTLPSAPPTARRRHLRSRRPARTGG